MLLVGCFLNPLLLEMEFIVDTHQRVAHRTKAEKFACKLAWKQKEHLDRFAASEPTVDLKGMVPEPNSVVQVHNEAICSRNNEFGSKGRMGGKIVRLIYVSAMTPFRMILKIYMRFRNITCCRWTAVIICAKIFFKKTSRSCVSGTNRRNSIFFCFLWLHEYSLCRCLPPQVSFTRSKNI